MLHLPTDSTFPRFFSMRNVQLLRTIRTGIRIAALFGLSMAVLSISLPGSLHAQNWNGGEDDKWSQSTDSSQRQARPDEYGSEPGWSVRAGIGFIDDPNGLLLNFEAPYAFDQWVSAGPMMQVGIDDNNTIIAPSLNLTLNVPDLPGEDFDRIHPFGFVGIGFAYIEDDNRQNDNSSVGFLINFGFGLEYQVSERFFLGSQMMFNFLPEETLEEHFFYSWQVGGARFVF